MISNEKRKKGEKSTASIDASPPLITMRAAASMVHNIQSALMCDVWSVHKTTTRK